MQIASLDQLEDNGRVNNLKMTAYWSTLFYYAQQEAKARAAGDQEALERAEAKHRDYRALCMSPDVEMVLDTDGDK